MFMAYKPTFVVIPAGMLALIAGWYFLLCAFPVSRIPDPWHSASDLMGFLFLLALYDLLALALLWQFAPGWPPGRQAAIALGVALAVIALGLFTSHWRTGIVGMTVTKLSPLLKPASWAMHGASAASSPLRRAHLLSRLRSDDVEYRRHAASVFAAQASAGLSWERAPGPPVLLALARGLRDGNEQVRESCANALQNHAPRDPAVLKEIRAAADDPNPEVSRRAAGLLKARAP